MCDLLGLTQIHQNRTAVAFDGRQPKIVNDYKHRATVAERYLAERIGSRSEHDGADATRIDGRAAVSVAVHDH